MRYLQFAFSYKGVLSRTEFLFVLLSNYIISIVVSGVVFAALGSVMVNPHELEHIIPVVVMLIMLVAMSSPAVRRVKDMGAKGWWVLGLVVPYLNVGVLLAKLAKADGVVSQPEINVIQNWFTNALDFSKEQQEKAIQLFRAAKNSDISFEQYARNFSTCHKENIELFAVKYNDAEV